MKLQKYKVVLTGLILTLTLSLAVPLLAQTVKTGDETTLKQIILFGRHSIRSSTVPSDTLDTYAEYAYPHFTGVPVGYLTPRGRQAAQLLGGYFRDYLTNQGVLTGSAPTDLTRVYFRANSIQRSNITASFFGLGLMAGTTVPVHSFQIADPSTGATMVTDPVFDPVKAGFATVDPDRALAEVLGVYGSGAALASAYASELALISNVLYPSGIVAPGKVDPTNQTTNPFTLLAISPVPATGESINGGGLSTTINATDPFVMQYSDNFALSDVAWGRLTPATLSQVTRLNVLQFNIEMRMPYVNQVQSSNAASHVLRSMIQFLSNTNIRGAFGDRKSRVVVAVSSDGYVAGLAGLLGVHWTLPGYQTDFCAPGGALVFELRQNNRTKQYVVRVYYTAQTFDQLRGLTTLSIDTPPATQQLMVPGGSTSSTDLDIPWPTFRRILTEAIGQKYVQPFMRDIPPGVLNNVPLE